MNRALAGLLALGLVGCKPPADAGPPRSTLVVGLDVSGSFRQSGHFDKSVEFAALYIYGHLNGLGGLRQPTDVFIGSMGGQQANQPKAFHPIQDLSGKSIAEIERDLKAWFPETDPLTDFNTFFHRVSVHVRRQNLVLSPLSVVMFSDGEPDFPGAGRLTTEERYRRVDLTPLEYLSRSTMVRLLYPTPTIAVHWERGVERRRVRLWTVDAQVMAGWREQLAPGAPAESQDALWKWITDNVDFRVRARVL